jgi:hypothetical protein
MSDPFSAEIEGFNAILKKASNLLFMARDAGLQHDALIDLQGLDHRAEALKQDAIAASEEALANLLLGFQCAADSFAEEIQMWLSMKDGDPERAWVHLVAAQEAAAAVIRTRANFGEDGDRSTRLLVIEKLLFPPQLFMSIGALVSGADCSICGEDYEDCDHIAGEPHWGRFCAMIPRQIEPDHTALVRDPADKRCRVAFFSDNGQKRNRMTWALSDETMEDRTFQGVMAAATGRWSRLVLTTEMFKDQAEAMPGKPVTGGWA